MATGFQNGIMLDTQTQELKQNGVLTCKTDCENTEVQVDRAQQICFFPYTYKHA